MAASERLHWPPIANGPNQARAMKRAGELLDQIERDKGGRPGKTRVGVHPGFDYAANQKLSRAAAAAKIGMSENQRKTAREPLSLR